MLDSAHAHKMVDDLPKINAHNFNCSCDRRNDEQKPRRIAALRGIEVTQVSTGGWHCLALDSAGMVYAWGGNEYGQCHVKWAVRWGTAAAAVDAHPCSEHACAEAGT